MKKLLGLLLNPWLLLVLGVVALCLVIWVVGPMLAIDRWRPLESSSTRWGVIAVIVGVIVLRKAWHAWKARRTNDRVVAQLVAAPAAAEDRGEAEVAVLRERFGQALEQLRRTRFAADRTASGGSWSVVSWRLGKRYLYELPWYAIIGAPGSGKTTALLNSGLRFPLAASGADQALRGVGGTRNCDWWFTDEAVLIDTAGRYTTHTSDAANDAKAWQGFLQLLKRSRPRQALNGVLVTVAVPDLLLQAAAERSRHALAVRQRVQELHQFLGVRLPIYLLVTKCDLLCGFTDYLGDIDKDTRATPWGFTFAVEGGQSNDPQAFRIEYDALEQRLNDGLIDRLQRERDPQRRARIYGFPQQFAGVRDVLHDFVQQVFAPSQHEAHPMLRGVYFVSGTQEGTPIDRMIGRISRSFGLAGDPGVAAAGAGKSYFLTRLLREVVFAESGLGGTNLAWERTRNALAAGGYALVALAVGAALFAWGTSYVNNRKYVAQIDSAVTQVEGHVQAAGTSGDVRSLLPVLEATRALARQTPDATVPWSLGFGLYQGHKLDAAAQQAYRRLLTDSFLPRLASRVEQQMRAAAGHAELQYEALKTYVMLHEPQRFNAAALKLFVTADWEGDLPKDTTAEQRAALEAHLDALLAQGPVVSPLALDKALLAQTRTRLAGTPLPERIYRRLKRQGVGQDIAEFTIAKVAGPAAALVFRRASGAPLTQGIAGLYTYDGYHKGLQKEVSRVADQLADEETWVLGRADTPRASSAGENANRQQVSDQVRRLYLNDYAQAWEAFIADIKVVPTSNLSQSVQVARILSAPDNPLVPLLRALSRETTLGDAPDLAAKAESATRDALQKSREELRRLLGTQASAPTAPAAGRLENIVDSRFSALRQFVNAPGGQGPAPVDATIELLNQVYVHLNAADTAVRGGTPPPPSEVPNKVKADGARTPEPVRSMLQTLSVSGTSAALDATRSNLGQAINAQIGEFCRQAIVGRYPFVRGSSRDVTQEDFARLFAPSGLFDDFFQKNLQAFVDTSTRPWSFRQMAGASMGSPGTLLQFQQAAAIRDTFFRAGGAAAALRLEFKPVEMDAAITQFVLDVDGQVVRYSHGPQIPASVQWPGPRGSQQVRVQLTPASTGASGLVTEGPWALFRLFDRLQLEPGAVPERFRATFNIDGRRATFELTTSSVRNPFRLRELEEFSCPSRL
jgi:type VI secretion system protein ImpL